MLFSLLQTGAQSFQTVNNETVSSYKANRNLLYQFKFTIFELSSMVGSAPVISGVSYISVDTGFMTVSGKSYPISFFLKTNYPVTMKSTGSLTGTNGLSFESSKTQITTILDYCGKLTLTLNGVTTVSNLSCDFSVVKTESVIKDEKTFNAYAISGVINPTSTKKYFLTIYISQIPAVLPG